MAAFVQHTVLNVTTNVASYASATFTPSAGSDVVPYVIVGHSGNQPPAPTISTNASGGLTFTLVASVVLTTNNSSLHFYVGDQTWNSVSQAITYATNNGNATGCHLIVGSVTGMGGRFGAAAVRQFATLSDSPTSTKAKGTFPAAPLTGNPTFIEHQSTGSVAAWTTYGGTIDGFNTAGGSNQSYGTPTMRHTNVRRDSGWTSTVIESDDNAATLNSTIVAEFDSSTSTTSVGQDLTGGYAIDAGTTNLSTLTEDFNSGVLDTNKLVFDNFYPGTSTPSGADYDITAGKFRLKATSTAAFDSEGRLRSVAAYTAVSSSVTARVEIGATNRNRIEFALFIHPVGLDETQNHMVFSLSEGVFYRILRDGNTLELNESAIAYSETNHAWWRLEHDGTNLLWKTAPDASGSPGAFTTLSTYAAANVSWDLRNVKVLARRRNMGTALDATTDAIVSIDVINPATLATVGQDLTGGYGIATTAGQDRTGAYAIVEAAGADLAGSYAVVAAAGADHAGTYAIDGPVGSDHAGAYAIVNAVGQDQAGAYAVLNAAGQDHAGAYGIVNAVGANLAGTYAIVNAAGADRTGAYAIAEAVGADHAGTYGVVAAVGADHAGAYGVVSAVGADLAGAYAIESSGAVGASLAGSYEILTSAGADLAGGYALAGSVSADHAGAYFVREAVGQDFAGAHAISAAVGQNQAGTYSITATVLSDRPGAYSILVSVGSEGGGIYSVFEAVGEDLAGAYAVAAAVASDLVGSYAIDGPDAPPPFLSIEARINRSMFRHLSDTEATLAGSDVVGIFEDAFARADVGFGMASAQPAFTLPTSNISGEAVGQTLTIGAQTYTVAEHHPDGTGVSRLLLERAT